MKTAPKTKPISYSEKGSKLKFPFVCLHCRKSYRRFYDPALSGVFNAHWIRWAKEANSCPQCGSKTHYAGKYFKAPRKSNKQAWDIVEALILGGFVFEQSGMGELRIPTRMAQVPAFLSAITGNRYLNINLWPDPITSKDAG